jgi:toxin ParE1/3/4
MKARFSPQSREQLAAIRDYIAKRSPGVAELVRLRIVETVKRLQRSPWIGRAGRRDGTRELRATGLPFVIVYRIDIGDVDELVVLGIFHTAQDR